MLGVSSVGAMLTLLPWGLAADRVGERVTGAVGLLGASAALAGVGVRAGLRRAGRAAARSRARSGRASTRRPGRAVTSWFPREKRGFALGIRQTLGPDRRLRGRPRHPADRRPLGLAGGAASCSPASRLVGAVLAAAWLVEGPVRSDGRGRDRRAAPSAARPADLAAVARQLGADLHAGRGHRLRRPLPRVAARLQRRRRPASCSRRSTSSARRGGSGPAGSPTAAAAAGWR